MDLIVGLEIMLTPIIQMKNIMIDFLGGLTLTIV